MAIPSGARSQLRPPPRSVTPRSRFGRTSEPNTITASQARAARRREARRDEQAVQAWLREIATRPR